MTSTADFEAFVKDYQDMVYSTALRLLARPAEAEDMAQEAFLRAFERFDDIKGSPTAGGWLKTVTTNLCLNHLSRYRKRWRFFSEMSGPEGEPVEFAGDDDPVRDWAEKVDHDKLRECLQSLPDHQRVPLVLFHFEELSYEETARKLGAKLSKVKSDMFRGRAAIRRALEEQA